MIKYTLIFISFFIHLSCFSQNNTNFNRFLEILGKLESNNNDAAIGDNGLARGRYQIHRDCFLDAQKYDKNLNKYSYSEVTNKMVSDMVVRAYCMRYEPKGNFESWARLWNSGPGWKNKRNLTNKYYQKFLDLSKQ